MYLCMVKRIAGLPNMEVENPIMKYYAKISSNAMPLVHMLLLISISHMHPTMNILQLLTYLELVRLYDDTNRHTQSYHVFT